MNTNRVLSNEFVIDPLSAGYNAIADIDRFDYLVNKNIIVKQSINIRDIKSYLTLQQKWFAINTTDLLSAKQAVFTISEFKPAFDMSIPGAEPILINMLDALNADSMISTSDKDYILSLGNKKISRAEQLGINNLKIGQVIDARI